MLLIAYQPCCFIVSCTWIWPAQAETCSNKTKINCVDCSKGKAFPLRSLGFPANWDCRISIKSVHECGKVVSPTHRPIYTWSPQQWMKLQANRFNTQFVAFGEMILRGEGRSTWRKTCPIATASITNLGINGARFDYIIHSFISNLSDDRSTVSSKTIPPINAI